MESNEEKFVEAEPTMKNSEEEYVQPEPTPKKKDSRTVFGITAGLLIVLACILLVVVFLVIDPFKWGLFGSGGDNAALESMPVDTALYVGINMDEFTITNLAGVIDPFLVQDVDMGYREFAELINEFDDELEGEVGFNLTDDILPWLGPNVAVGLVDYEFGQYGDLDRIAVLLAAETKDGKAADGFIDKLKATVEEESGLSFIEVEYEGVTIYEVESEWEDERFALARPGDLVYVGTTVDVVKAAIDAASGDSLADDETYRTLSGEMASNRAITLFFSNEFMEDSTGGFGADIPIDPQDLSTVGLDGAAVTLSFVDQGVQIDGFSALDSEGMADVGLLLSGSEGETAEIFPEETVIYIAAGSINQIWENLLNTTPEYEEAMAELQDEIGFDIIGDLVVFLDGETGIGLWPSTEGLLARAAQVPLAFSLLAGTSDDAAVQSASQDLSDFFESQFLSVESSSSDGRTIYTISEPFSGIEAAFGASDGYFFLASGQDAVEEMFGSEKSLADSSRYKEVWTSFDGDIAPTLYIDVAGLMSAIQDAVESTGFGVDESVSLLTPINYIAAGSEIKDDVAHISTIIFLNGG